MTLRLHPWRRHVPVATGLAMLLFALPACATPRPEARFDPPIERLAPRGGTARAAHRDAHSRRPGSSRPRLRRRRGPPAQPHPGGTGGADRGGDRRGLPILPNLAYRGQPCAIYDLTARWTLASDERLRLCAPRGPRACAAPP